MSKKEQIETKVVTATGFHGGKRMRRGDTFNAPVGFEGKWFTSSGSEEAEAALHGQPNVIELSATEVKAKAPSMTSEEINAAIAAEQGSKKRRNVLNILQDELENRVGAVGGPDPAAKNPAEKDPLIPGDDILG